MAKYVIPVIAGVVLLLVLTYIAGVWSEEAASKLEGPDMAGGEIKQDGVKVAKRPKEEEPEPEPEPEPEMVEPPPVPPYPYSLPEDNASIRKKLEKKIVFAIDNLPLEEALEMFAEVTGVEISCKPHIFEGTFPISYKAQDVPAWLILKDLLFIAEADYNIKKDHIVCHPKKGTVSYDKLTPAVALDIAKEGYLREKVQEEDWWSGDFSMQARPLELLQALMYEHGILPTKKALTAASRMEEDVEISAFGTEDLVDALENDLDLNIPKGNAEYPMKIIGTTEEVTEWNKRLEDYGYAREDFYPGTVDGEIKDMQLYKIAAMLEEETGVPVLVDRQAWEYADFITLEGKDHSVKDVLDALEELGFVNILLIDPQTRRDRLFIFAKPE